MHLEQQGTAAQLGHALTQLGRTVLTFVAAVITGFVIPAGWIRVGGEIQSNSGKGGLAFVAVAVIFMGIVASYFGIIWAVGVVAAHRTSGQEGTPRRYNWNRSLSAERKRAPSLNPLETVFVWTAILVGMAYMVWFFFFAGSSIPLS